MMAGVGSWLLSITGASVLCALADGLMPAGPVRRVGRLVCGLVLLAVILAPLAQLDLKGGSVGWRNITWAWRIEHRNWSGRWMSR